MSNLLIQWEVMHFFFSVSMEILDSIPDPGLLVQETDQLARRWFTWKEKSQKFVRFLSDFWKCYLYHLKNPFKHFFLMQNFGPILGQTDQNLSF